MPNFEQYNPVKEHLDTEREKKSLKDITFKFSEKEREEKMKSGMTSEEIETQEKEVIERQKLSRAEKKESEENGAKPKEKQNIISFEEYKAKEEKEYQEKLEEIKKMQETERIKKAA